jgi:hypothetical protein
MLGFSLMVTICSVSMMTWKLSQGEFIRSRPCFSYDFAFEGLTTPPKLILRGKKDPIDLHVNVR